MFKAISVREINKNAIQMIADEWMLVTAGTEAGWNTMTASWGGLGEMWVKDVAVTVIRPQRYTYEFIEKTGLFTLSFFGDSQRKALGLCGSKSGREIDKAAATGLVPVFEDGVTYFEQAELVLVCQKLYAGDLNPAGFVDPALAQLHYPNGDFHRVYVGEIVKTLVKE